MTTYYTIYETTNNINGKYYIGAHKTNNPYDSYLGSGSILKQSFLKYGRTNFHKKVLFCFSTKEEMWLKEKEIVNTTLVDNKNCYNISYGGKGNNIGPKTEEHKIKIGISNKGKTRSLKTRKQMSDSMKGRIPYNKGMKMSNSQKIKISKSKKGCTAWNKGQTGFDTHNKGKIVISLNGKRKYIIYDNLSYFESVGWKRGLKN